MLTLIVVHLQVDENDGHLAGHEITEAIAHMNPLEMPHFAGAINIVPEPYATSVVAYLEGKEKEQENDANNH